MIRGLDESSDGSFWFTDVLFNSLWKFSPDDESYDRPGLPGNGTLPQKIQSIGSDLILNDFTNGTLAIITPSKESASLFSIPQIFNGSAAGDFAVDKEKNIWHTAWIPQDTGSLIKFNHNEFKNKQTDSTVLSEYFNFHNLPKDAATINGLDINNDKIWIADTSSSLFF